MNSLDVLPAPDAPPARSGDVPISETFFSIQGEGKLAGVPSVFVRFAGCNLRCRWCDTPYASWAPESTSRTIDELVELAGSRPEVRHAVLTGGEPMLFPQLTELSARLASAGLHTTIETAGTVIPPGGVTCHLISISPKLSNSTPVADPRDPTGAWAARHEERRLNPRVLQALISEGSWDRQLKFVATEQGLDADVSEAESLLAHLRGWRPEDVLLMPEGVTPASRAFAERLVNVCSQRGWRYCPRLHIELWGNQRGK